MSDKIVAMPNIKEVGEMLSKILAGDITHENAFKRIGELQALAVIEYIKVMKDAGMSDAMIKASFSYRVGK